MTGRGLSGASRNPNCFCIRELTNAKRPQFTSEAGSFDSPERQARIGGDHIVDEHHAALKLRGKQFLLFLLACPNAGPQSVNAIEIGRASCRERVKVWVGGWSIKEII